MTLTSDSSPAADRPRQDIYDEAWGAIGLGDTQHAHRLLQPFFDKELHEGELCPELARLFLTLVSLDDALMEQLRADFMS